MKNERDGGIAGWAARYIVHRQPIFEGETKDFVMTVTLVGTGLSASK